ncbi:hypothetical protein U91I_03483 [alpha proteobacterium U9-1i]|nr:hypothetical protein U91I_03483 [alpha proteobacterium U9-1i]
MWRESAATRRGEGATAVVCGYARQTQTTLIGCGARDIPAEAPSR